MINEVPAPGERPAPATPPIPPGAVVEDGGPLRAPFDIIKVERAPADLQVEVRVLGLFKSSAHLKGSEEVVYRVAGIFGCVAGASLWATSDGWIPGALLMITSCYLAIRPRHTKHR